jgi:gluconolactonase
MKTNLARSLTLIALLGLLASACASAPPPPPKSKQSSPKMDAVVQAQRITNTPVQQAEAPVIQPSASTPQTISPTDDLTASASQNLKPAGELTVLPGQFSFTEGPAADSQGRVYFSDINAGRIYRWSADGPIQIFKEGLKGPNGLAFTKDGSLIVCEGGNGRLIAISPQGQVSVLAEKYNQIRFNEPNDLWVDTQGGIYFSDPAYQSPLVQDGEHVYYLSPDRSQVTRVISDLVRPNGLVGSLDSKTLYVADHGAGKIFTYQINPDGSLTGKKLFISLGSDGMELDSQNNLYLTTPNQLQVFDKSGQPLYQIAVLENPTNLAFSGQTLFITARTAVYTLALQLVKAAGESTSGFTLNSPAIDSSGLLPVEYTCDGISSTLPLTWQGAPAGTKSYALLMDHIASPDDIHWYWVLYNISPNVTNLEKNSTGIGTLGINGVNKKIGYAPPCSKGPGPKTYTYTIFALSSLPQFSVPPTSVNREELLKAIQSITLDSAELKVTYSRPSN